MTIWIDDDDKRSGAAQDIEAEFVEVKNKDIAPIVDALLVGEQPDMVVLDHILDKTTSTNPIFSKGSTIAEAVKEKWPNCPVIGVTNADINGIDLRTQRAYDGLFAFPNFSYYVNQIKAIREGFATVNGLAAITPGNMVELLSPPEDDSKRLLTALPTDLKKAPPDLGVTSLFYSWVVRLFDRAGFLYDDLWAATFCGLNPEGFKKVMGVVEGAKYEGVFKYESADRWWSSEMLTLLYTASPPEGAEMSWKVGHRLDGVTPEDYSECDVCGELYPETVAFVDAPSNERRQVHSSCTVLHPRYERELYFEDIRMMFER